MNIILLDGGIVNLGDLDWHPLPELGNLHAKHRSIIINLGRGALVRKKDMAEALAQGKVYGAGIDVLDREPPQAMPPLISHKNVNVPQHIAGASQKSCSNLRSQPAISLPSSKENLKMRYLLRAALGLVLFFSPLQAREKERTRALFLHLDYAYTSLSHLSVNTNPIVQKREPRFYRHHLKKALSFQRHLRWSFPYESLSAADRNFAFQSLEVWGRIIRRNLDTPNLTLFQQDMANAPLQRDRLLALEAAAYPPSKRYALAGLNNLDQMIFHMERLPLAYEASQDKSLPAKARRQAKKEFRKKIKMLDKKMVHLSVPLKREEPQSWLLLSRTRQGLGRKPTTGQIREALIRLKDLRRLLQKSYYLPLDT